MQILLIEDDDSLASHISAGLRESGHIVTHRADGREGLLDATCETYDVIVLDRMLPSVDGLKILATRDLPPADPAVITRVRRFGILAAPLAQARRVGRLLLAGTPGALVPVFGFPATSAA